MIAAGSNGVFFLLELISKILEMSSRVRPEGVPGDQAARGSRCDARLGRGGAPAELGALSKMPGKAFLK